MKKILIAVATSMALTSVSAFADYPSEQVWNATLTNNQITCGIDYANANQTGGILTSSESSTDTAKAVVFNVKANTSVVDWKITEAKLTQNTGRFDFDDNLMNVGDKTKTSLFVNNQEYAWTDAAQNQQLAQGVKVIRLAPKINLAQEEFPTGTTTIQGKIVVSCSN